MNVLVLGSGGREHALVHTLRQSPLVQRLYCAPGNPGTLALAECPALDPDDHDALRRFVEDAAIDLVLPGPERYIAGGVADALAHGRARVFAPSRAAAAIESSKTFGTTFRDKYNIPSPRAIFANSRSSAHAAAAELIRQSGGVAVKADGLCAGKGVVVTSDLDEARAAIDEMLAGRFGAAGARLVLEELVVGEELSVLALCDGTRACVLAPAQDYKRLSDGNSGPNTGGMGSLAPAPRASAEVLERVRTQVLEPTLAGLAAEGLPYRGVLYAGLILREGSSQPLVLEYNARFGDPETQVLLPMLDFDLAALAYDAAGGQLTAPATLPVRAGAAVCVVLASAGYPEAPRSDEVLTGIAEAEAAGALVFHAGTALGDDRSLRTAGGRVLGVTATGPTLEAAATLAHAAADHIAFAGLQRRRDIGLWSNEPSPRPLQRRAP